MTHRAPAPVHRFATPALAVLAAVCAGSMGASAVAQAHPAAASPAAASAPKGTGGGGLPGSGNGVTDVHVRVSASGAGMRLTTIEGASTGHGLSFSGTAAAADRGRSIEIESARRGSSAWARAVTVTVGAQGRFSGSWKPAASGLFSLRAELLPATSTGTASAAGVPHTGTLGIEVFKPAGATLYGPGLYGNTTYCGQTLKRTTIGVASRTLKCGTKVAINYRDHVIVVPVIDRGPYDTSASWDLTMATGKKIGMTATGSVGTITPAP